MVWIRTNYNNMAIKDENRWWRVRVQGNLHLKVKKLAKKANKPVMVYVSEVLKEHVDNNA